MGFRSSRPVLLTGSDQDIFVTPSNTNGGALLYLNNRGGSAASVTVKFFDYSENQTTGLGAHDVAPNGSEPGTGENRSPWQFPVKFGLESGDKIIASCASGDVLATVTPIVSETAPVAKGFTPRGAHSTGANYVPNDIVARSGSSYVAINANTNDPPPSSNWMLLSAKGDTGLQGVQGEQGEQGPTGATPLLSVGTVTTLSPGANATATINTTDPENPVLSLGIPRGNPGTGDVSTSGAVTAGRLVRFVDSSTIEDAGILATAVAPLASPTFTGTPTAPTAAAGTNTTQLATTAYVVAAVAALINAAPGALDTLDELAAALGDDANFAATVTTALAGKVPTSRTIAGLDLSADRTAAAIKTALAITLADVTDASANGRTFVAAENYAAMKTLLGLSSAAALDVEEQTITGGARVTSKSLGTVSTGTLTLDPGDRQLQHYTNNGAHTLSPGANTGSLLLDITNGASAGAVTTSGWTKVAGDSFTTTSGNKFRCHCSIGDTGSLLIVQAMQ